VRPTSSTSQRLRECQLGPHHRHHNSRRLVLLRLCYISRLFNKVSTPSSKDAKADPNDELSQRRLSCSLYLLLLTKTIRKNSGELVVTYPRIRAATGGESGEWKNHPLLSYRARWLGDEEWNDYLVFDPLETETTRLQEWIQRFEDLTNDRKLQSDLNRSLNDLYKSDQYLSTFLEEIRKLRERWKSKFEGDCEICRNTMGYHHV
jgi:hypothetical protein